MSLRRIIMHWTAGGHSANSLDRKHYHEIVEGDGTRVQGDKLPEANESTRDGHYAAHTRALNTGSIGLSMAAMSGARERPFAKGKSPITEKQLDAFVAMVAEYADTYAIEITRETVLTHAEVQRTLGVAQRGKWDITWIPGMDKPGDPVEVGDRIRAMIKAKQAELYQPDLPALKGAGLDDLGARLASHITDFLENARP
ncbi:N-acetylmuramoyl-L-alanine amidase [Pseudaestuariivita rosea]|uniref:peptidoglycan recognition protein family protein n=1 Tax=Pseudaestuariivita rosea TaxID=2763263 RepID=UPI001ABA0ACF|nr:N-acetylmuramoyl-L-alanine amidase [Pseudaestuariivita rosea]